MALEADLGVIDLTLPDGEGTELIEELREANPDFAALVLTASLERTEHARAVEAGAAGVLHKSADVDAILDATRRLGEGETLLSEDELIALLRLAGQNREEEVEAREHRADHTREREVLQKLAEGLSEQGDSSQSAHERGYGAHPMMNILTKWACTPGSRPWSSPPATAWSRSGKRGIHCGRLSALKQMHKTLQEQLSFADVLRRGPLYIQARHRRTILSVPRRRPYVR